MRNVRIEGEQHNIPDDREWRLITQSFVNYPTPGSATTEYFFRPHPCNYVEIRQSFQKVGFRSEEMDQLLAEEWEALPSQPLAKYLVADPNAGDQSYLKNEGLDEWSDQMSKYNIKHPGDVPFSEDFAGYEKRFLAALDKPAMIMTENPCAKAYADPMPARNNTKNIIRKSAQFKPNILEEVENVSDPCTNFSAGTRVLFTNNVSGELETGTIVGRTPGMRGKTRPSEILIATDKASNSNTFGAKWTGKWHGIYFDTQKNKLTKMDPEKWELVPTHIGVVSLQGFIQDHVKIYKGRTGRIINGFSGRDGVRDGMILVSWNFSDDRFSTVLDGAGIERHNIWEVPASKLGLCSITRSDGSVKVIWPNKFGQGIIYKVGDICRVSGRSVSVLDRRDREVVLSAGTVVELLEQGDKSKAWRCRIIGGCVESILNQTLNIREDMFKQFPDSALFYRQGQNVEIVAKVDFRKKPLQGMTGKVILSTDAEGDVGIEFPEDIGAGSLDGIGKEGHCIYIEASLVKSSE